MRAFLKADARERRGRPRPLGKFSRGHENIPFQLRASTVAKREGGTKIARFGYGTAIAPLAANHLAEEKRDLPTSITDYLRLIHAEYLESPGLQLTKSQVQRFWGLDPIKCEALLGALVDVGFLRRTARDGYIRVSE